MAKNNKKQVKKTRSKADIKANILFAIIIIAFLVLAGFALYPKVSTKLSANSDTTQAEQQEQQPTETVASLSEQLGITPDEFIKKYNLNPEEITSDTDVQTLLSSLKVRDYYELSKDMNSLNSSAEQANEEGKDAEASNDENSSEEGLDVQTPSFPESYEDFIAQSGLDASEVNDDMSAMELMTLMSEKAQAEQATSETSEGDATDAPADTSAPEAQLED